jgi:hypothetical protein
MILETTNPKYQQRPQIPAGRKFVFREQDRSDLEYISQGSLSMARGELQTEQFRDRRPTEAPVPIQNREPEPRPMGSSLCLFDEAHDAPLWLIIDNQEGCVFARVRGSLTWVVNQLQLAADQLGGKADDLYFRMA